MPSVVPRPDVQDQTKSSTCELHIWPSRGLRSSYHGWLHGGIVDGAVNGRSGYPSVPEEPLEPQIQIAAIERMDSAQLIGRNDYKIVTHAEPLTSTQIRADSGRLAASSSDCYAEYIVDTTTLRQDFVNGSALMTLVRFRDYATGDQPVSQFGSWVTSPLLLFPPAENQDPAPALDQLHQVFVKNLGKFKLALDKARTVKRK